MNRRHLAILTIVFLSTYLGYQLIDLINYIQSDKAISYDTQIETPQIIDLEAENKKEKLGSSQTLRSEKIKTLRKTKGSESKGEATKPVKKNKFLNVIRVAEDEFRYSKEDYEGEIKKFKASNMITVESNWEKKVLESETLIEKSLKNAALIKGQALNLSDSKASAYQKDMERYALKIELPNENIGTKVKLQYREPPEFGNSKLPEPILADKRKPTPTFSIQKTKATESPWDNFSGPKNP